MSFIDSVKQAGSNAIHHAEQFAGNVKKAGENVVHDVEKNAANAVHNVQQFASNTVDRVQAAEHHAVQSLQARGNQVRFKLDQAFDTARAKSADAVHTFQQNAANAVNTAKNVASTTAQIAARGLNQLTHPGNPNPPGAQGLSFAETKNASALAYDAKVGDKFQFADGGKWKVVDAQDDKKTGFRAIALQSLDPNDKRTIVAFAGTDPKSGKDIGTDVGQAVGINTKQYKQAADFAQKWKNVAGDNAILTGHSLGGGLSSYASIKTGLRATALNSAPLALNHLGGNPLKSSVRNNPKITQYYVPGEALTALDQNNPLDVRPGNKIAVQGRYSNLNPLAPLLNHMGGASAPNVADAKKIQ